jgi:Predicted membrane protein
MKEMIKKYRGLFVLCVIYAVVCYFTHKVTGRYLFLVWNLFLAILPLLFSLLAEKTRKKNLVIIFSILWLLFYPNAPYFVTDFIHITRKNFFIDGNYYDLEQWLILITVSLGFLISLFSGFVSLDKIKAKLFKNKKGLEILFIIITSLLSGYAIYIGRFLRFNSWDILRPISLMKSLLQDLDKFAMEYSLLIGIFIVVSYYIYKVFKELD